MSRISALESELTRHTGSSANVVAQCAAQSQVPMTLQAYSTLASESHSATALETLPFVVKATGTTSRHASATGHCTQPSLHGARKVCDIPAASKDVVRVQSEDGGGMPTLRHHGAPHSHQLSCQPNRSTFLVSPRTQRPHSTDTPGSKLLGLGPRLSAQFEVKGARSHGASSPLAPANYGGAVLSLAASGTNPDMQSPQSGRTCCSMSSPRGGGGVRVAGHVSSMSSQGMATSATRMADISGRISLERKAVFNAPLH